MQSVKVASRFLLPLETFLGFVLISWAVHASFGNGYVTQLFGELGEAGAWTSIGAAAGIVQLGAALIEFLFGRHWPEYSPGKTLTIHNSVMVRIWGGVLSVVAWSFAIKLVYQQQQALALLSLTMIAVAAILFSIWTIVENWRVRSAVDPRVPTYLHFYR